MFSNTQVKRFNFIYPDTLSANDVTITVTDPPHAVRPATEDAYKVDFKEGGAHVYYESNGPTRAADADNIEYEGSHHLCNACLSALGYLAGHLERRLSNKDDDDLDKASSVVHQWNLLTLNKAASAGCHICRTIWDRCIRDLNRAFSPLRTEFFFNTLNSEPWQGENPGDVRLMCALTPAKPERVGERYFNIIRFQLWPSPAFDRYFVRTELPDLSRLSLESPKRDDEESPKSDEEEEIDRSSLKSIASQWLAECKRNTDGKHDACNTSNPRWRPTRLLDLETLKETGKILLASGSPQSGGVNDSVEYITLSHCWGEWGPHKLPLLTTSNLEERQSEGMDRDILPATFKDAVEIANWFNGKPLLSLETMADSLVKWLWIDSLCILQDSRDDWEREAPLMRDVYRNAFLNLSAEASKDARGGCIKNGHPAGVTPFKLHMRSLGNTWWVSVDERSLFEWMQDDPLSKRAWVYQERHLSRRVLHFTGNEVFWECCATAPSFRSETYPSGSPLSRDFLGGTKLQLPDPSADIIAEDVNLCKIWNEVCENFSKRLLTYSADKLPALSGLAKDFGTKCLSDSYVAGMWRSALPSALLWDVPKSDRGERKPPATDFVAPSWSWMFIDGPVACSDASSSHSILRVVNVDVLTKTEDPYGQLQRASLDVEGFIRRVTFVTGESAFAGDDYVQGLYSALGSDRPVKLYVDDELDEDKSIGGCVGQMFHFYEAPDYRNDADTRTYEFLLVAVEQATETSDRALKGLLLEATDKEDAFRRVGCLTLRDANCNLQMRYQLKSDEGDWSRLLKATSPYWKSESRQQGPKDVAVNSEGPSSLYDFDGEPDLEGFEKLEPRTVTLV